HYDGVRHLLFVIPMLALLAGGALLAHIPEKWAPVFRKGYAPLKKVPLLWRWRPLAIAVAAAFALHAGVALWTMARLHPFEYVAFNWPAGGTKGAEGRFELDYWGAAASEAIRQLERSLDGDARFAASPPRVLVCLIHREWLAGRLFRRNWIVETEHP